ncbi:MAG TPA: hypothetical protein DCQ98_14260 [Planctomycetaceae bacterium]|nr:hypothetical protein [Planctomycetaceae bacterium]HRF02698.1 hypothetical protein [Pirellulaceae bacterium]
MSPRLASLPVDARFALLPPLTLVELSGADAGTHLHRFCTQDLRAVAPGGGREAMFLDAKGKLTAHGIVLRTADRWWFLGDAGQGARLAAHLDRYVIREEVRIADLGDARIGVLIRSSSGWNEPTAATLPDLASGAAMIAMSEDEALLIVRDGRFGADGVIVIGTRDAIDALTGVWDQAGNGRLSDGDVERARIEAGWPRFGVDVDAGYLAQELDRDRTAISFVKGCYLGQETVARIDALGHVNRKITPVRIERGAIDVPAELFAGDAPAGRLTSRVSIDGAETGIGLATLKIGAAKPGTVLRTEVDSAVRITVIDPASSSVG